MRVLWLSHLIPHPPKAGVLLRAYNMVRELARHHEVDLLAFHQEALMAPLVENLDQGISTARDVLAGFCGRLEFFPTPIDTLPRGRELVALKGLLTGSAYNLDWLRSRDFAAVLRRWMADGAYDLVHFDTISLVPYKRLIGATPAMLDHHNIESHMLWRRADNESSPVPRWYYRREAAKLEACERRHCPAFALNITCSDLDTERLRQIAPGARVETVPNGVDVDFFRPGDRRQVADRLIFVGTLNWYPNVEAVRYIAREIWPGLKQRLPGATIDIIGANPPQELLDLAARDRSFRVHGFVDDLHPFMDEAAVYVCPIMDGGGTKLKVLDALAMAKAVVAHPIACEGIAVTDGLDVRLAETPAAFIDTICALCGDEAARLSLGRAARRLAESRYAYDAIGRQLADLVTACAGGGEVSPAPPG